ncbi:nucleotide exchange factor GrpE [Anditalea andensis]|uniref:Protein GrpE n=1 Tax=Anditalea andensis TaxID=1048983 RepID=A0A074KSD3_9BACT|nr:nucleotide exchange factor GrpE [Anditalea andensis]KEO72871.1 molecular chaperone GrpE [Anditalea andensis]
MADKDNLEQKDKTTENLAAEEQIEQDAPDQTGEDQDEKEQISVEDKFKAEAQELKDKYLRLYSEFENYRRRTAKERLELIKTASEDVLKDLIPVVDDFERAIKAADQNEKSSNMIEGKVLIYNKLLKVLESKGVKPMDDLIGNGFDSETQEAITQIPAPTDDMKGKVIDVVEKGYTLGDKVIRYAKVVIGS